MEQLYYTSLTSARSEHYSYFYSMNYSSISMAEDLFISVRQSQVSFELYNFGILLLDLCLFIVWLVLTRHPCQGNLLAQQFDTYPNSQRT